MGLKKRMIGMGCAIAVIVLCSVNMTYAWQNLTQTALNVNMGERWDYNQGDTGPDGSQTPPLPDDPTKPGHPNDPANPDDQTKPDDKDNPGSTGQAPGTGENPGNSDITNGKSDIYTGDTGEVMIYMLIMLLSFILMSVGGGVLVTLVVYKVDRRRR